MEQQRRRRAHDPARPDGQDRTTTGASGPTTRSASTAGAPGRVDERRGPANASILDGLVDDPVDVGPKQVTFTVTPEPGSTTPTMVSPATPIDGRPGRARVDVGQGRLLRGARARRRERAVPGDRRRAGPGQRRRRAERRGTALAIAVPSYPPDLILDLYTQVPAGRDRRQRHRARAEDRGPAHADDAPIDIAEALRQGAPVVEHYHYSTDVTGVDCGDDVDDRVLRDATSRASASGTR